MDQEKFCVFLPFNIMILCADLRELSLSGIPGPVWPQQSFPGWASRAAQHWRNTETWQDTEKFEVWRRAEVEELSVRRWRDRWLTEEDQDSPMRRRLSLTEIPLVLKICCMIWLREQTFTAADISRTTRQLEKVKIKIFSNTFWLSVFCLQGNFCLMMSHSCDVVETFKNNFY